MKPPQQPIKGLCFDKDGTLFDFAATWEAWAANVLLRTCGGDTSRAREVGLAIGFDLDARRFAKDSIVIAGTVDEIVAALVPYFPEYSGEALRTLLNAEASAAPQVPVVPLVPLLSGLRGAGLVLGLATNDSEGPARVHMESVGITGFFDFIAGYDSGFGGKPAAGQLLAFAKAVDVVPEKLAMVGDSTHDLIAGRAAGMRTVAVLTGAADAEELAPYADVVLANIGEIPDWLAGMNSTEFS